MTVNVPMSPREALIRVFKDVALGDFGHDLPDAEFWTDVDGISSLGLLPRDS